MTNYVKEYMGHKVPDGATHAREFCGGSIEFYKSGFYFRQADHSWRRQTRVENFHESTELPQEPESKEWVDGLPPAGCECEAAWLELPDGGGNDFCKVLIKAYYDNEVWFFKINGVDGYSEVVKITDCEFRPLKTEKEKEREAFIEKANLKVTRGYMVDQATGSNLMEIFGDMFDAGFKAPEGE